MTTVTQYNKNFWKPSDVEFVFQSYSAFEKKFIEIQKVFPFETEENLGAWSPELVSLFLDICSTIDSISRHIIGQGKELKDKINVKDKTGKIVSKEIKDLNVEDFESNLWNDLEIMPKRVVMYVRSEYPNCAFLPFKDYRDHRNKGWWFIYNNLKHNRISFRTDANIQKTSLVLAALLLLLASYYDDEQFTLVPLYLNWLNSCGYATDYVHKMRLRNPKHFWLDTELFGVPGSCDQIKSDDITQIHPPLASQKFQRFVGRFNPVA